MLTRGRKPSGSEATESRMALGEASKKSNEGVDLGAKRSETLIYIYFIYMFNNIFNTSANIRVPRVFEFYGCRNVGLWV